MSKSIPSDGNREFRFFEIFKKSPPLHLYLMQFVGFLYMGYRFASRNYSLFGYYPDEAFNYSRTFTNQFIPIPFLDITTFQFIYHFVSRPSPEVLALVQCCIIGASVAGLVGLFPRVMALIVFLLGAHLTGMSQSLGADVESGTLILCLMLILVFVPSNYFYGWRTGFNLEKRDGNYHWPVMVLFILVAGWYSLSGLSKLIDIGPHWPFVLHLENLAQLALADSLLVYSDYRIPAIATLFLSYPLSVFGGTLTLIAELGFFTILFLPRYRLFFVGTMSIFHFLVFALHGFNFLGNVFILLLCLDWNVFVRKVSVYYDANCGFCQRSLQRVRRFDWFGRITYAPISNLVPGDTTFDTSRLQHAMGVQDENGEVYYGADGFEQVSSRCPGLLWFSLLLKVPGCIYIARLVYGLIAKNRMKLGCGPGGTCQLPSNM